MHRILNPGVALLNCMTYVTKFILGGALFSLLLLIGVYQIIPTFQQERANVQAELNGVKIEWALSSLLKSLQQHRGFSAIRLTGDTTISSRLTRNEEEISKNIADIEASGIKEVSELATTRWEALKRLWNEHPKSMPHMLAADNFKEHTQIINDLLGLMRLVADSSNLALDSNVDSYYLGRATTTDLPMTLESMAQMRAIGSRMFKGERISLQDKLELASILGVAKTAQNNARRDILHAVKDNHELRTIYEPLLNDSEKSLFEFSQLIDENIFLPDNLSITPIEFFSGATPIINKYFSVYDNVVLALEGVLKNRLDDLSSKINSIYLFGAITILLISYFAFALYASLHASILAIRSSAQKLAEGDLSARISINTRDEMAEIANSFNTTAEKLTLLINQAASSEQLLSQAKDELEMRVAERTRDLEDANQNMIKAKEAAEEASRAKSDFLATMSHEVRTPMNGIIGMTELALDSEITASQRECLDIVKSSADTLLTIINEILDFSKIEAGKLELEKVCFDVRDLIGETMKSLALRAHQKNLHLIYEVDSNVPEYLSGDPGRLRQIIVNLVGNSIKFTQHGNVSLIVSPEETRNSEHCLHFEVVDTGIGIPSNKLGMIFDAFSQADNSTTRVYGGTGLGLTISSRLVSLMGGKIWVESEFEKGSRFCFTAWFDVPDKTDSVHISPRALKDVPVLIVDDNKITRRFMEDRLRFWGMRPEAVDSAEMGLESLDRAWQEGKPFALVLLDDLMPGMDGFEMLERIRINPDLGRLSVLMFSSTELGNDRERALQLGVKVLLTKPVTQSELLNALVSLLAGSDAAGKVPLDASVRQQSSAPSNVLLVEDNFVNRKLAVSFLEKWGHNVVTAENGQQALDILQSQCFELVLMDVQMPVMGGFEATAQIRERERQTGQHIPILAMTANAMPEDRERCLQAGMDGYIPKPIKISELFNAIEKVLPSGGSLSGESRSPLTRQDNFDYPSALVAANQEVVSIIGSFMHKDCPHLLKELVRGKDSGDHELLKRSAHTLKGLLGNFGESPALKIAEKANELAVTGRYGDIPALLADMENELAKFLDALALHLDPEVISPAGKT